MVTITTARRFYLHLEGNRKNIRWLLEKKYFLVGKIKGQQAGLDVLSKG